MEARVVKDVVVDEREMVVLTKPDCPKCEAVARILDERGIPHRKLRFSSFEARQLLARHHAQAAAIPVILYRGRVFDSVLRAIHETAPAQ